MPHINSVDIYIKFTQEYIQKKKNPNLLNWVIHSLKNTADLLIVHIGVLKWNSTAIVIFQKYILISLYFKSAQYGH